LDVSAPVASPTAQQNLVLRRLVRIAALVLVVGVVAFVALYLLDQRVEPSVSLADRKVATLEADVRKDPQAIGPRLQLAAAYAAAGRPKDAVTQYDEVLKESPQNVIALLGKADTLQKDGDLTRASAAYQQVVVIRESGEFAPADAQLAHAYYGIGVIAAGKQHFAEAIAALESAVRIDGTDADTWYQLGLAQLGAGSPDKAVAAERNAVSFVPLEFADPYAAMAKAYTAMGKPELATWAQAMTDVVARRLPQAKAALEPLLSGPAAIDATVAMGFVAEMQGDNAAALDWYRKALALDPKNVNAQGGLARLSASPLPSVGPSGNAPTGSG
jgi:tetratricopeptide (TPR) repeat protein